MAIGKSERVEIGSTSGQETGLQNRVVTSETQYWASDRSGLRYGKFLISPTK